MVKTLGILESRINNLPRNHRPVFEVGSGERLLKRRGARKSPGPCSMEGSEGNVPATRERLVLQIKCRVALRSSTCLCGTVVRKPPRALSRSRQAYGTGALLTPPEQVASVSIAPARLVVKLTHYSQRAFKAVAERQSNITQGALIFLLTKHKMARRVRGNNPTKSRF